MKQNNFFNVFISWKSQVGRVHMDLYCDSQQHFNLINCFFFLLEKCVKLITISYLFYETKQKIYKKKTY